MGKATFNHVAGAWIVERIAIAFAACALLAACAEPVDQGDAGAGGEASDGAGSWAGEGAAGMADGAGAGSGGQGGTGEYAGQGGEEPAAGAGGEAGAVAGAGAGGGSSGDGGGGGGGNSGAGSGGSGGDGGDAGDGPCVDSCPAPGGGVEWQCQYRFMYGVNYAWRDFGADFGGIAAWGQQGVAAIPDAFSEDMRVMREHGVSVVRWWMFPDFRGDGVLFDAGDDVTGLQDTALDDVRKALELAEQHDLYLMFTIFSFDNFRASRTTFDVYVPGIQPLVVDDTRREMLMENLVRPLAQAVEASPYRDRAVAWDVINEPEWAVTGPSLYGGDEPFDPDPELQAVSHQQMETFIKDVVSVLREESSALITVGGAAMKWKSAWSNVDLDFEQLHMYDWINDWWPYDQSPASYGLTARPLVMGEFFLDEQPLSNTGYRQIVDSWYDNGYAGALSWQFNEATQSGLDLVAEFAADKGCTVSY
jgi:hypothetical protein